MNDSTVPPDRQAQPGSPWYHEGLCFACTQCGDCCRHEEGYVWITTKDVTRIAEFIGIDEATMTRNYVRRVGQRLSLIEKPNLDCIFWKNGCSIYPVRPIQCRTYPFWPEIIESRADWEEEKSSCPGIGGDRHYSGEEIEEFLAGRGETGTKVGGDCGGDEE